MPDMRFGFALLALASLGLAADVKTFHQMLPLEANGRFTLETYKGSIRISAWDKPQVEIDARIEADLSGGRAVPVEDVEIRADGGGGSVSVHTDYRRQGWNDGNLPFVHYTIHMPRGAALHVKDYKSESDIAGVEGDVEFETYKGTARIEGLRRGVSLQTYKGDIRAILAAMAGPANVETYKGTIDMTVPRASRFNIDADLERRATFDCAFPVTIRAGRQRSHFRTAVNGGGPELHVRSYRGDIRLRAD